MSKTFESDLSYHGPVVVFDLDDTLYSEHSWALGGYKAVAEYLSQKHAHLSKDDIVALMREDLTCRRNPFDALETYLTSRGINESIPELVEIYRYHTPQISLFPDAKDFLDKLQRQGIRMGLITDGRSRTQRLKIKALGIEHYFHPADILISEEIGKTKESGEPFRSIVHHYPEAAAFYYIGDNPAKDIEAPTLMGWHVFIRKASPLNIHEQNLSNAPFPPEKIFDNFDEIFL